MHTNIGARMRILAYVFLVVGTCLLLWRHDIYGQTEFWLLLLAGLFFGGARIGDIKFYNQQKMTLSSIIDNIPTAIYLKDKNGQYLLSNRQFEYLLKKSRSQIVGANDSDLFDEEQAKRHRQDDCTVMQTEQILEYEENITTADGKCVYINKKFPVRKNSGEIFAVCGLLIDITAYKIATENFARSSRAYQVLSRINAGMKHAASERGWLQDVCRYLVELGGYRMAWIGIAQRGAGKFILPVADAGDDFEYLSSVKLVWGDNPDTADEPNGMAVREKRIVTVNDLQTDKTSAWRDEAIRRGYMSMCCLPIRQNNNVLGDDCECMVLCICSTRKHAFDDFETRLMHELADDVGFGMRTLRERDESVRMQVALSEETQKFEKIVQGINAGVMLMNAQGKIIWVNDQFQSWFGQRKYFMGVSCEQSMGDGGVKLNNVANDVFKTGKVQNNTINIQTINGENCYYDIVSAPLFNEQYELVQVVQLIVDVTDKKLLEDDRLKSDRQLRDAQRIAHIGSWELNLKNGKLVWSDEVYRIFGMSREKNIASYNAFLDAVHPDDRENVDRGYAESLKSNKPFEIVYRVRLKDGRSKYVHERCETEFDSDNVAIRSLGTVQDITDQVVVEQALFESEEHYRRLIESSTAIPWEMDAVSMRYLFVGARADKLLGIPSEEWCHDNFWLSHMHHDDRVWVTKLYKQEIIRGDGFDCEYRLVTAQGKIIWVRDNVTVLREPGKSLRLQGFMFDVTEMRNVEEIARRTQKMDAVGQLTGGIAHDFNNQLGVIQGYLDFLRDYTRDKTKPQHWVEAAADATKRCIDLSRKLLDFSRKKAISVELVNINSVLEKMRELIARSVTTRISVNYQAGESLWSVAVNSGELEDAILNMVINARDAMPENGQLILATENININQEISSIHTGLEPGDYVHMFISDNGTGIQSENIERIFEPFFTTKSEGSGTGLGLAMVYSFVKRSGGIVNVFSKYGEGTILHIYFPRHQSVDDSILSPQEINIVTPEIHGHGEVILVVDDEEGLREVAVNYLARVGYSPLEAANAEKALGILQSKQQVDLLFTDVIMLGMNGYQLAEKARQLRPDLKILLTSGFTGNATPKNDVEDQLLNKPYNHHELIKAVDGLLKINRAAAIKAKPVQSTLPVSSALRTNAVKRKRLVILDDEVGMGKLVCDLADHMGWDALHYLHASEFIQHQNEPMDALLLDLMMPDMDGVEMIRLLAELKSKVPLVLISGVDKSVLHSAQELAYEHKLNLLGTLQKPFMPHELKLMLSGIADKPIAKSKSRKKHEDVFTFNEAELQQGLSEKQFIAFFQPQIALPGMQVIGFEALMRWQHPQRGLIPPNRFIPLAEKTGLIDEMTWQLFDQIASDWKKNNIQQTVSLNMTAGMFKNLGLPDRLHGIGSRYAFNNNAQIVLEVTESALMGELTKSLDSLTRLRMKGFHLSIDDFGTGFSSMLQLHRAPFTELKIDQSFVMRMEKDVEARTIVESTINLAHNLNMKVVAEGVETEFILKRLSKLGCDIAQGYHIARPMPIAEAMVWMDRWRDKNGY